MAKTGSASKTVKTQTTAKKAVVTEDDKRGTWLWLEREEGKVWMSGLIPLDDVCAATVKRSFSKDGGKWWFYAYRNGKILGKRDSVTLAQELCRSGKADERRDNVSLFVSGSRDDIPAFLRLSEEERRQVREHYKHHAPAPTTIVKFERAARERGYSTAADITDPSTVRLLAELAAKDKAPAVDGARPARSGGGSSNTTKAERASVEFKETGKLSRLREGNPKKEGSAAYRRWALMFEHCDKGSTVKEFLAAGGNPETLKNACLKGWAEVK